LLYVLFVNQDSGEVREDDRRQTDGRQHIANVNVEFTLAKKPDNFQIYF